MHTNLNPSFLFTQDDIDVPRRALRVWQDSAEAAPPALLDKVKSLREKAKSEEDLEQLLRQTGLDSEIQMHIECMRERCVLIEAKLITLRDEIAVKELTR